MNYVVCATYDHKACVFLKVGNLPVNREKGPLKLVKYPISVRGTLLANRWLNKPQLLPHRAVALTFLRIISSLSLFLKKNVTVLGVVETISR